MKTEIEELEFSQPTEADLREARQDMARKMKFRRNNICGTIRQALELVEGLDIPKDAQYNLQQLLTMATVYAKRMNAALIKKNEKDSS